MPDPSRPNMWEGQITFFPQLAAAIKAANPNTKGHITQALILGLFRDLKPNTGEREGHYWHSYAIGELRYKFLPHMAPNGLTGALTALRESGLLLATDEFNKRKGDKTLWYRLNYAELEKLERLVPIIEPRNVWLDNDDPRKKQPLKVTGPSAEDHTPQPADDPRSSAARKRQSLRSLLIDNSVIDDDTEAEPISAKEATPAPSADEQPPRLQLFVWRDEPITPQPGATFEACFLVQEDGYTPEIGWESVYGIWGCTVSDYVNALGWNRDGTRRAAVQSRSLRNIAAYVDEIPVELHVPRDWEDREQLEAIAAKHYGFIKEGNRWVLQGSR